MSVKIRIHENSAITLSEGIIKTVAELSDKPPQDLPPFYDFVDPEAVDRLFSHNHTQQLQLKFRYCGYDITVEADGTIVFEEL